LSWFHVTRFHSKSQSGKISGKNVNNNSNLLSINLSSITKWLKENKHLMKPKTRSDRGLTIWNFQNTTQNIKSFEIYANKQKISVMKEYKNLGVTVDRSLNMASFFNKCYKRALSHHEPACKSKILDGCYFCQVNLPNHGAVNVYILQITPTVSQQHRRINWPCFTKE